MNKRTREMMHSSKRDDYCTPKEYADLVRQVGGGAIGLDPCSNAQSVVGALVEWKKEDRDGLGASWQGYGLVYVNMPYGGAIADWIHKCRDEAAKGVEIIALVPARPGTAWFVECGAHAQCDVKGRIKFIGAEYGAPFDSVFLYWGNERGIARFISAFRGVGRVLKTGVPPTRRPLSRQLPEVAAPAATTRQGLRIATYHRVSTVDQDVTLARGELRGYCNARGVTPAMEIEEVGSGAKNDRPGLRQVLEAAQKRTIDMVVVWKLDRWGRSALDMLTNVKLLTQHGVGFTAITQGIIVDGEGSPMTQLVLSVMAAFAELERDIIRARSRLGIDRARKAGRKGPGRTSAIDGKRAHELHEGSEGVPGLPWRMVAAELGCHTSNAYHAARRYLGQLATEEKKAEASPPAPSSQRGPRKYTRAEQKRNRETAHALAKEAGWE